MIRSHFVDWQCAFFSVEYFMKKTPFRDKSFIGSIKYFPSYFDSWGCIKGNKDRVLLSVFCHLFHHKVNQVYLNSFMSGKEANNFFFVSNNVGLDSLP